MFGSTVLEVAVGLIFTFLMISLITSAVTEALASVLGWRANTLLDGVKSLLNDDKLQGLALDIYNHALVNPRGDGNVKNESGDAKTAAAAFKSLPSYIDPAQFASAFTEIVGLTPSAAAQAIATKKPEEVTAALMAILPKTITEDKQLNELLEGIIERSAGDVSKIQGEVCKWFDSGMERVSGVYKRHTQAWSLGIAFALALFMNIDVIAIASALWKQPMLIGAVKSSLSPSEALKGFESFNLPYGWNANHFRIVTGGGSPTEVLGLLFVTPVGWLIAAISTLLGAPFWFDALQKIAQIRGADGAKGSDKSTKSA